MRFEDYQYVRHMTPHQQVVFTLEMNSRQKNKTVALIFFLFTGPLGGHHFYLDRRQRGLLYVLFCWTFIPALCCFFDSFYLFKHVDRYNQAVLRDVLNEMLGVSTDVEIPSSAGETKQLITALAVTIGMIALAFVGIAALTKQVSPSERSQGLGISQTEVTGTKLTRQNGSKSTRKQIREMAEAEAEAFR